MRHTTDQVERPPSRPDIEPPAVASEEIGLRLRRAAIGLEAIRKAMLAQGLRDEAGSLTTVLRDLRWQYDELGRS